MPEDRATWVADSLAVYRSVTSRATRNHYRSRMVFGRYLLPASGTVRSNYLGRIPASDVYLFDSHVISTVRPRMIEPHTKAALTTRPSVARGVPLPGCSTHLGGR
jgi:hypothetical protein